MENSLAQSANSKDAVTASSDGRRRPGASERNRSWAGSACGRLPDLLGVNHLLDPRAGFVAVHQAAQLREARRPSSSRRRTRRTVRPARNRKPAGETPIAGRCSPRRRNPSRPSRSAGQSPSAAPRRRRPSRRFPPSTAGDPVGRSGDGGLDLRRLFFRQELRSQAPPCGRAESRAASAGSFPIAKVNSQTGFATIN